MMDRNRKRSVAVIGGGLGGLAAACTLAARGHRVVVYEANSWMGGKAAVLEDRGFRFDMGPTILTLPSVLRRIFSEAGRRMEDHLDLRECDPQWRCFFEGGGVLDLHRSAAAMRKELDAFSPGSSVAYEKFLAFSKRLDEISQRFFFDKSVEGLGDTFDVSRSFSISVLADVLAMRPGRSVASTIRGFVPDPRVAQMLDHFTQYVGSAPDQSPAVLCGIAHMQTRDGVHYPIGGTRAVPVALERLAVDLGVEMRTETAVSRLSVSRRAVEGVILADGRLLRHDAVVSNMDAYRTYSELLSGTAQSRAFLRKHRREPACSGVVLYLGLNRRYEHLQHHNFVFSSDPGEEFADIYRRGEPARDPTCYVCAPSFTEAAVAPKGGESLYVLVHTPYLRPHHDWPRMFPVYRKVIIDKLARCAGLSDIERRIVVEHALTPQDIHERYRVLDGAIYGIASHGRFLGAFKPGNRRPDLAGLYLAGGAAHPGPGMPMVLMSGWIAADALDRDSGASRLLASAAARPGKS